MLNLPPDKPRKTPKAPYRKPQAVKELEEMFHQSRMNRYPNQPGLAYLTFRDDTANNLTKCIVKYIELKGGFASRINNQGTFRDGRYTFNSSKKGIADVMGTYKGRSLNIEVKIGKDRMSEAQINVQEQVTKAGGVYYIAKNFTDFKTYFDNL